MTVETKAYFLLDLLSTVPSRLGFTCLLSLTFCRYGLLSLFRDEFVFPCVILMDSCLALDGLHYGQKFKSLRFSLGGLEDMPFAAHFICFLVPSIQHTKQNTAGLSDSKWNCSGPPQGIMGSPFLRHTWSWAPQCSQQTSRVPFTSVLPVCFSLWSVPLNFFLFYFHLKMSN